MRYPTALGSVLAVQLIVLKYSVKTPKLLVLCVTVKAEGGKRRFFVPVAATTEFVSPFELIQTAAVLIRFPVRAEAKEGYAFSVPDEILRGTDQAACMNPVMSDSAD